MTLTFPSVCLQGRRSVGRRGRRCGRPGRSSRSARWAEPVDRLKVSQNRPLTDPDLALAVLYLFCECTLNVGEQLDADSVAPGHVGMITYLNRKYSWQIICYNKVLFSCYGISKCKMNYRNKKITYHINMIAFC